MVRRALCKSLRGSLNILRKHAPLPRYYTATVLPLQTSSVSIESEPSTSNSSPHERRIRTLKQNLLTGATHARVWDSYTDIISASGVSSLPLELHQEVLRQCSPPKEVHRENIRYQLSRGTYTDSFHIHENRFQAVIQNITNTGDVPTVEDFNFIMDHMAAIGYYQGVLNVYKHMASLGITPTEDTFNACFRSIAFRLSLPIQTRLREDMMNYTTAQFQQLMADHNRHNIEISPANMNLILRILKETLDQTSFEFLLRTSYGIDLANPDRLALEYKTLAKESRSRVPLPFTTATLNTTLDMLGRIGDISRLVSAFEVLTNPLPQAEQHFFNTFEEEDDFGAAVDVNSSSSTPPPRFPAPYATPNTTSFNIVIRYVCREGYPALARHYVNQAIRLDRSIAWTVRHMIQSRRRKGDFSDVPAPHFALSRLTLVPVLGEANREKNLQLMKWLHTKIPYMIRKQTNDLEFYEVLRRELHSAGKLVVKDDEVTSAGDEEVEEQGLDIKPFDISLQIRILRRNIAEITEFSKRLKYDIDRTSQRVKERIGRRVWKEKDVYFRSVGQRVNVSKDEWKGMVNFRPMDEEYLSMRVAWPKGPFTSNPKPTLPSHTRKMSTIVYAPFRSPKSISPPVPILWYLRNSTLRS